MTHEEQFGKNKKKKNVFAEMRVNFEIENTER